jgi:isopenicillin-N N-acyltransferase-like protein
MADKAPEPQIDVVCEGRLRDMGLAQGAALREPIRAARQRLFDLEAFILKKPRWLPCGIFRSLAERKSRQYLAGALRQHAPEVLEQLAGLAEGAGVPLRAICLMNVLEAVLSSAQEAALPVPAGGCSAVAVRGSRSATGEAILAQNFDYLPLIQPFYTVRDNRPQGQLRSLDFTIAPLCGTVDGMNERGLCIVYNYAYAVDAAPPAPTISLAIAEALRRFGTVAEAVEWIASRPRTGAGILMLADAAGDIASLELSNTRSHLRRPEGGDDFLLRSNVFFAEPMQEVQVSRDAVYTRAAPAALRGSRVLASHEKRDRRFAELLRGTGRFGPDELARLMADHGPAGVPETTTPCVHSPYWNTTACLQFFPRSRTMRVAYDFACRAEYREFAIGS